jgi:hypothetical protein
VRDSQHRQNETANQQKLHKYRLANACTTPESRSENPGNTLDKERETVFTRGMTKNEIRKGQRVSFTSERTGRTETGTVNYVLPYAVNVRFDDNTCTTVPTRTVKAVR